MLDVATGNGSVPRLLLEMFPDGVQVDAVDMARLKPTWLDADNQPRVHFHPGVAMEELPFPAASFDLVTSQFGIEYGQWPQSIEEAVRVCKPAGRVALLMHHVDSLVVRMGRIEARHQQFLLADDGVVAAAGALVPHLARVAAGQAPDAQANACRQAYNTAMGALAERLSGEVPDLLLEARQQVHAIVAKVASAGEGTCLQALQAYAQALQDASLRTVELLECALDEERCAQFVRRLQQRFPDREVRAETLVEEDGILGWGVMVL